MTLEELRMALAEAVSDVSVATLEGLQPDTWEKSLQAAEQHRADVAAARDTWRENQVKLNLEQLVLLRRNLGNDKDSLPYGCPRGQHLLAAVSHRHWKTWTFVAGFRMSGLIVPLVLDGAWMARRPGLRRTNPKPVLVPGDLVILENFASHKVVADVREAIEASTCAVSRPTAPTSTYRRGLCQAQSSAPRSCPPHRRPTHRTPLSRRVLQPPGDYPRLLHAFLS